MSTDKEPPEKEIVPFHEAKLPKVTLGDVLSASVWDLRGGRTITVSRRLGEPSVSLVYTRPTGDGKVSKLAFALTSDAALATLEGLRRALEEGGFALAAPEEGT